MSRQHNFSDGKCVKIDIFIELEHIYHMITRKIKYIEVFNYYDYIW